MTRIKILMGVVVVTIVFVVAIVSFLFSKHPSEKTGASDKVEMQAISNRSDDLREDVKSASSTTDNSVIKSRSDKAVVETKDLENLIEPGFYAEPWKRKLQDYENLVDVPIKEITEPENYTLKFNPIAGRHYRYVSIASTWSKSQEEPLMRIVTDGKIATRLNDEGELLIDQEQKKPWGLATGAEMVDLSPMPTIKRQLLVRDSDLYLMQQSGSESRVELTPFNAWDREQLIFDLPKDAAPQVGKSWTTNKTEPFPISTVNQVTHKLIGFADVGGVTSAKFISESNVAIDSDGVKEAITAAKINLKNTKELSSPVQRKTVTYIDLETGLVVRTETEIITQIGKYQTKTIAISQRISLNE